MTNNFKTDVELTEHPKYEGVFMKHFFCNEDNDRLNNFELIINTGSQITPHIHENSTEFFYVVSGQGEFLDDTEWIAFKKGDAFKAPTGITHSIKNTGSESLVLLATFSPAIR